MSPGSGLAFRQRDSHFSDPQGPVREQDHGVAQGSVRRALRPPAAVSLAPLSESSQTDALVRPLHSPVGLLNANKIHCVRANAFQDLQNLSLLSLYDNKIQTLAKGTFASLRAIQTLVCRTYLAVFGNRSSRATDGNNPAGFMRTRPHTPLPYRPCGSETGERIGPGLWGREDSYKRRDSGRQPEPRWAPVSPLGIALDLDA
ncbi:hypothetical protein NFI96_003808 [Prochilodus magdalenae]|nr:hypothetical protein NFI96_003808 [Prochilodus magdalenae]